MTRFPRSCQMLALFLGLVLVALPARGDDDRPTRLERYVESRLQGGASGYATGRYVSSDRYHDAFGVFWHSDGSGGRKRSIRYLTRAGVDVEITPNADAQAWIDDIDEPTGGDTLVRLSSPAADRLESVRSRLEEMFGHVDPAHVHVISKAGEPVTEPFAVAAWTAGGAGRVAFGDLDSIALTVAKGIPETRIGDLVDLSTNCKQVAIGGRATCANTADRLLLRLAAPHAARLASLFPGAAAPEELREFALSDIRARNQAFLGMIAPSGMPGPTDVDAIVRGIALGRESAARRDPLLLLLE